MGIKRKGGWKDITQILFLRDKEREERAAAARRLLIEPGHVYIFLISCALHCDTKSDVRSGTARDGPSEGGKGFPSGSGACELLGMGDPRGKDPVDAAAAAAAPQGERLDEKTKGQ